MIFDEYSTDGGNTWHELRHGIRVLFLDAAEDDDGFQDLHMNITSEGLIFDLVDRESGLVVKTGCKLVGDIAEELT